MNRPRRWRLGWDFLWLWTRAILWGNSRCWRKKPPAPKRKLVAFKMQGRCAPPRPGYSIWTGGSSTSIGTVTSGTQSPTLGMGIGLGYVGRDFSAPNTAIEIEIRGQRAPATIVAKPIYKSGKNKTTI